MLRPFCMLLWVVAQSLKPVKLSSQQLPTFLLFRDRRRVAQQWWIRLHSSSNIVGATHAHYTWSPESYELYPSHDALQVTTVLGVFGSVCTPMPTRTQQLPTLLVVVASVCTPLPTQTQQLSTLLVVVASVCKPLLTQTQQLPNIFGCCCIRLHTIANTDATTSNIVGVLLHPFANHC